MFNDSNASAGLAEAACFTPLPLCSDASQWEMDSRYASSVVPQFFASNSANNVEI